MVMCISMVFDYIYYELVYVYYELVHTCVCVQANYSQMIWFV